MTKVNVYSAAGTAGVQMYTAVASGWVSGGAVSAASDVLVQAGVTTVAGTADALYKAVPAWFQAHQVDQSPY